MQKYNYLEAPNPHNSNKNTTKEELKNDYSKEPRASNNERHNNKRS